MSWLVQSQHPTSEELHFSISLWLVQRCQRQNVQIRSLFMSDTESQEAPISPPPQVISQ